MDSGKTGEARVSWRKLAEHYPGSDTLTSSACVCVCVSKRLTTRGRKWGNCHGNYRRGGTARTYANNVLNIAANEVSVCEMRDCVGRDAATFSYKLYAPITIRTALKSSRETIFSTARRLPITRGGHKKRRKFCSLIYNQ